MSSAGHVGQIGIGEDPAEAVADLASDLDQLVTQRLGQFIPGHSRLQDERNEQAVPVLLDVRPVYLDRFLLGQA